ncbi:MAG: hypothetical protein ACI9IP_001580 [Arcticibacterium sp.]|jgi:hypothetical protein
MFGTFFDPCLAENKPPTMQVKTFVPAEHILQVMEMSKDVFNKEEELEFLKSCLYYLNEGMTAMNAIEMSMVDYLVDM